jgi:hypothetical protein
VKGDQDGNRGYEFDDRHRYRIALQRIGKEALKVKRQGGKNTLTNVPGF